MEPARENAEVFDDENQVHQDSESDGSSIDINFSDSEDETDDDYFDQYVDHDVEEQEDDDRPTEHNDEAHENAIVVQAPASMMCDDIGNIESDNESISLHSNGGSDEEEGVAIMAYPQYNPSEMCREFKFKLGMEFTSIQQFKEAVREYALLHGYDVRFVKNDKVRCRVRCQDGCEWMMFVSKVGGALTYRLKTYKPQHTCGVTFSAKMATSKWIADQLVGTMRINKNMKLSDVIATVREKYMADISISKAYWSRRRAKGILDGSFNAQYAKLWDYINEILTCNPGTTFMMHTVRPEIYLAPVFKRLYLCLEPVKRGFLAACRPIIGLDGCFLKGPFGGILLVAVARDPNDQYFPLAVAVVEGENKDSWHWFLSKLLHDIGDITERRWVFISDQQKGLMPTFDQLLRGVEHRLCVRHLYANIKTRYGGGTVIRNLVLQAAKATYVEGWEKKMLELKNASKEAHDHLMNFPPSCWTKSHFEEYPRCDMILNNISESFNGQLLEARELPIISLFEWIRTYLMTRFTENRKKAEKFRGKLIVCPKPRRRLDKEVQESRKWVTRWAGSMKFEVSHYQQKFKVDLDARNCSCRWWGLTGIPCRYYKFLDQI